VIFFIIFGTKGVTSRIQEGQFHCPNCNSSQPYRHNKVRRFFTLYFIPLIPLGTIGEHVECETCKTIYNPNVLTRGASF